MRHNNIEQLHQTHPEDMERRQAATQLLASAALHLCSVNEIYLTEQFLGQVSKETQDQANEAGKRYNEAIELMLQANGHLNKAP
jgi:hypothetical protein